MNARPAASAEWAHRAERGSMPLLRFMVWFSLTLGRGASRVLLRMIAAYFLAFGGAARRAARAYLTRCLGRTPRLSELYGLFFSFAATIHDRVYFLKDRFDLFDIDVQGAEHFGPGGALMMGAHVGSFEAMRACGRTLGRRQVAMAMYPDNARKVNAVLGAIDPAAKHDIVELGRVQSMLELGERLEAGALVGVLADRTLGDEPVLEVPFLGAPAPFPTGPMRMAAALRRPVLFMAGLYRGGNRYEVRFEPLADFSDLDGATRAERDARVADAVRAYAARLEHHVRSTPDNWFNFHDFWAGRA
ncbi:MAG TPA: acyl-CoA synthetase [Usitatibacter sp.]|nr:acyl-CoA synthetase [Usitatibacter sp.]